VQKSKNFALSLSLSIGSEQALSLQYAYDTVLLLDKSIERVTNPKRILSCFELMSGMRINYDKSEMVPMRINYDKSEMVPMILSSFCLEDQNSP
jgi:hypothetical protein